MAISLDRVHRGARKLNEKQKSKKSTPVNAKTKAARPWNTPVTAGQSLSPDKNLYFPPLSQDPLVNFDSDVDLRLLPDELEASTSRQLIGLFARRLLEAQWRKLQRNSYWVSRITHQNSWWSRVKLYPDTKVPLPSWLTQRRSPEGP